MSYSPADTHNVAPWVTIGQEPEQDWKVLRLRTERRRHANDGREGMFTIADAPHWTNIIPVTTHGELILVEQFRHGTGKLSLELPGGVAHEGEDPRVAAERECLEETGWKGTGQAQLLGIVEPNPAFQSNRCSVFLWNNCEYSQKQELDPLEEIRVVKLSVPEFFDMIAQGIICHSLVLSAVALAMASSQLSLTSFTGRNNG